MFPLGTVLLPGEPLPLHVFEPRYRALVLDCLADADGPLFGVVLIARGRVVGGGDVRHDVGALARIVRHEMTPDGRFALMCVGQDRIRVVEWLPDDPYPRAVVEPLPDAPVDPYAFAAALPPVTTAMREAHELICELAGRLGREAPPPPPVLEAATRGTLDPTSVGYALAGSAPIGPADRWRVLCAPDAGARLAVLTEVIDDANAALRFRLSTFDE
jgi:ATP-dependent Lon protease